MCTPGTNQCAKDQECLLEAHVMRNRVRLLARRSNASFEVGSFDCPYGMRAESFGTLRRLSLEILTVAVPRAAPIGGHGCDDSPTINGVLKHCLMVRPLSRRGNQRIAWKITDMCSQWIAS